MVPPGLSTTGRTGRVMLSPHQACDHPQRDHPWGYLSRGTGVAPPSRPARPLSRRLLPQPHCGGRGEKARTSRLLLALPFGVQGHVTVGYGDVRTSAMFAPIAV